MPAWIYQNAEQSADRSIGTNDANNVMATNLIAQNRDGSIFERLEHIAASILGENPATFVPGLGYRVTKVENIETATGVDLFTVTGKVLLTLWTGEVTNALHTTVTDYKLRVKTDNVDLCAATNISSAAVGYMWSLSNDAGLTLLTGSTYAVSAVKATDNNSIPLCGRIIGLAGGSCVLQSLRTAGAASDSMTHTLFYLPLEASAAIVAA